MSRSDDGLDLVVTNNSNKHRSLGIQCKDYQQAIDEKVIKSLDSDLRVFKMQAGYLFYTNTLTKRAQTRIIDCNQDHSNLIKEFNFKDWFNTNINQNFQKCQTLKDAQNYLKSKQSAVHLQLRQYQATAVTKAYQHFKINNHPRGKLIMACGSGKTITSVAIIKKLFGTQPCRILFLVPSIYLMKQTISVYDQYLPHFVACVVCSDKTVRGKSEDIRYGELYKEVYTTPEQITEWSRHYHPNQQTIVFSTYQSLSKVAAAQEQGMPEFDLVICDEAHQTAKIKLKGKQKQVDFMMVHDQTKIKSAQRLYMTATPKTYTTSKAIKKSSPASKREYEDVELFSMDDEAIFGQEFFAYAFDDGVHDDVLVDFKVLVLAIPE